MEADPQKPERFAPPEDWRAGKTGEFTGGKPGNLPFSPAEAACGDEDDDEPDTDVELDGEGEGGPGEATQFSGGDV